MNTKEKLRQRRIQKLADDLVHQTTHVFFVGDFNECVVYYDPKCEKSCTGKLISCQCDEYKNGFKPNEDDWLESSCIHIEAVELYRDLHKE